MNHHAFAILFVVPFFLASDKSLELLEGHCATCYGETPCRACSSCRYCRHCSRGGGSCGVCRSSASKSYNTSYTTPKSTASRPTTTYRAPTVLATTLNVREGPGLQFPIIDRLPQGKKLDAAVSMAPEWVLIYYDDYSKKGYVQRQYVRK